jgi:seryl-tRNA synthetase
MSNAVKLQISSEELQSKANASAKQIGELMRTGKKDEAEALKGQTGAWKEDIKKFTEELAAVDE